MKSNWPNFFEILKISSQEQLLPCHATMWRCGAVAGWPSHTFHANLVLRLGVFNGGFWGLPGVLGDGKLPSYVGIIKETLLAQVMFDDI